MIELQVEAFFEFVGEGFQRRIIAAHVPVADRTHRHIRGGELRQVTARAIFVSGKAGSRGIVIPIMTTRTGRRCVMLTSVQELRVVEIVSLGHGRQGKRKKEKGKSKDQKTNRKTFCAPDT